MNEKELQVLRDMMYSGKMPKKSDKRSKTRENIDVTIARDIVMLEVDGKKQAIPTDRALKAVLNEGKRMYEDLRKAQGDIIKLTSTLRTLQGQLRSMQGDIDNKQDKYD